MNVPTIDIWTRPTEEAALARALDFEAMFDERLRTRRQVRDRQRCKIAIINLKKQHINLTANDLLAKWDGEGSLADFLEQFTWQ